MPSFKKGRILLEDAYQDWRNHKCNEDQVEKMDMLNKFYADSILSEQSNVKQNIEPTTDSGVVESVESGALDGTGKNMSVVGTDDSFVNSAPGASNVADGCNSNQSSANGLASDLKAADPIHTANEGNAETSNLAPPPSQITSNRVSKVYNCTPDKSSKTAIAAEKNPTKPFKCTIIPCIKSFTTKYNLKRHQEKMHGVIRTNRKSKIVKRKGKFVKTMPIYKGKNPKLIEIDGNPLSDEDNDMASALPLSDEDIDVPVQTQNLELEDDPTKPIRNPTQIRTKKRLPKQNLTPDLLASRIFRKRRNFYDEDEDGIEKYSRGSGSRFYYSWD